VPRTERVASLGTELDRLVLAVGAVVLVVVILMGAWVARANSAAPAPHPRVTVTRSGTGLDGMSRSSLAR
jgi:hypothetical protein